MRMTDELITTKQASERWGISQRRISQLCNENRIQGAVKKGGSWLIPLSTVKPDDARVVSGKYINGKKYTMVSLFSGCGGLDLGFSEAGFKIIWANDFDQDAQRIYELNIGQIDKRDILTVDENEIPDCDIVTAGFPCQPFSNAGNRKGIHDSRGMLYKECLRIIKKKQPKVFVFENVKGLLSTKYIDGRLLSDVIVSDLEESSNPEELGYNVTYKLLNASDYGVPQNRQRVFFVGIRKDLNKKFVFPSPSVKSKVVLGDILDIPNNIPWKDVPYESLAPRFQKIRDNMKLYHSPNFYRRFSRREVCGTITASAQPENCGIIHPTENRRYTIREIARIQSFPDSFKFIDETTKDIVSMYKVIGNAVPPKLAKAIAKAILEQISPN